MKPGYAFEAAQRFKIDWTHTFDAALVKAGTYQLQTLVQQDGSFAEFGGFQGLGAKYDAVIASFQVAPGEVVYVGDLDALVLVEGIGTCSASLSTGNSYAGVVSAFAKQVPLRRAAANHQHDDDHAAVGQVSMRPRRLTGL